MISNPLTALSDWLTQGDKATDIIVQDLPVFVINLDDRPDRWQLIKADLHRLGFSRIERFSAHRPSGNLEEWPNFLSDRDIEYRRPCLGCLQSHLEVIKMIKARGLDMAIIFEDDTSFEARALRSTQKALRQLRRNNDDPGFDILYLSGTHMERCERYKRNAVRVRRTFSTNAYIIRSTMYDHLIENLPGATVEIDVFYANTIQTNFDCFCVKPHATFQRASYSDIERKMVDYPKHRP